jgi:hypothetical protein
VKFLDNLRKWHRISSRFKELVSESPQIIDSLLELAEKTAKDAVLQKILDETQSKDITAGLLKKLAETAQNGIVINVKMNNADITFRKEDVFDDMARHRLNQILREGSGAASVPSMPSDLSSRIER